MVMGYGVPPSYAAAFPRPMYMMGSAGHDSHMASLSSRLPVSSGVNMNAVHGGVTAASLASGQTAAMAVGAVARPGTAAPGGPTTGAASKSKQGLEKILDTLNKMFPDVRRSVEVNNNSRH